MEILNRKGKPLDPEKEADQTFKELLRAYFNKGLIRYHMSFSSILTELKVNNEIQKLEQKLQNLYQLYGVGAHRFKRGEIYL